MLAVDGDGPAALLCGRTTCCPRRIGYSAGQSTNRCVRLSGPGPRRTWDVISAPPTFVEVIRAHDAAGIARELLADALPRRWAHSQGVAARARSLAGVLGVRAELVEAAAWLHDIGYAPSIACSGFHPLDGARYLRDVERADNVLCCLVAHHSGASAEAEERGLLAELEAEFALPPDELIEALVYCDMTTDPDGCPTTVEMRLAEVGERYGPDHAVRRAIGRSTPTLIEMTRATTRRLEMFSRDEG